MNTERQNMKWKSPKWNGFQTIQSKLNQKMKSILRGNIKLFAGILITILDFALRIWMHNTINLFWMELDLVTLQKFTDFNRG